MRGERAQSSPAADAVDSDRRRPTHGSLPWLHLLNLSLYWLGINVIWAGLGYVIFQARFTATLRRGVRAQLRRRCSRRIPLLIAVLVQPTVAAISDYTITRWGRRKPYIFIGALLDVVFLFGIAIVERVRGDPRVHDPAAVLVELRPGTVPGLRAGPRAEEAGRHGQRPDGRDDRPRPGRRRRDRHARASSQLGGKPVRERHGRGRRVRAAGVLPADARPGGHRVRDDDPARPIRATKAATRPRARAGRGPRSRWAHGARTS